jgi:hypothetical protein
MATLPAPERARLERAPANGRYGGRIKVRVIPAGVFGDSAPALKARPGAPLRIRGWLCAHDGCQNRRTPNSRICASHAARKKGPNRCSLCGALGHNARGCGSPR